MEQFRESSVAKITINSWNEWTEGTYLEPDDKFGYGYLDALGKVFVESCGVCPNK